MERHGPAQRFREGAGRLSPEKPSRVSPIPYGDLLPFLFLKDLFGAQKRLVERRVDVLLTNGAEDADPLERPAGGFLHGGKEDAAALFAIIYRSLDVKPEEDEPMMNVLVLYEADRWVVFVFPREKHRPACYTAEGEANLLSSPASVDLGGVFITPVEKDFLKITAEDVAQILSEVCLSATDFHKVRQRIREKI